MKKILIGIGIIALAYGLLVGASFLFDIQLGPPLYERNSEKYLSAHGFSPDVVTALLSGAPIDHETVVTLSKVPDVSVRHMLGRNQHLSQDERLALFQDKNEFVRQGVAMNPSLSREEISQAMADSSTFVWGALAMNPAVPADVLLELRSLRHVSLSDFAQNPKCPDAIVKEIEASDDSIAKDLLRIHGNR